MSGLIVHAGMSKAGSSTVQEWVRANDKEIRAAGITPVVVRPTGSAVSVQTARRAGGVVSSWEFVRAYTDTHTQTLIDQFVDRAVEATRRHGTALISCEGFGSLIARDDQPFLEGLQRVAEQVPVAVAYYVRPQHTALEAAWKQWGFRTGDAPSVYLKRRGRLLHYRRTAERVAAVAPSVEFRVRPFHVDLLDGGSVVVDFAHRFLALDDPPGDTTSWANPGLSLDLANLLRGAPEALGFSSTSSDARYRQLKDFAAGHDVATSERAETSRLVLRLWCRKKYGADNRQLVDAEGWPVDEFVPALTPAERRTVGDHPASLAAMDDLWEPSATPAERAWFHAALADAMPEPQSTASRALDRARSRLPGR